MEPTPYDPDPPRKPRPAPPSTLAWTLWAVALLLFAILLLRVTLIAIHTF